MVGYAQSGVGHEWLASITVSANVVGSPRAELHIHGFQSAAVASVGHPCRFTSVVRVGENYGSIKWLIEVVRRNSGIHTAQLIRKHIAVAVVVEIAHITCDLLIVHPHFAFVAVDAASEFFELAVNHITAHPVIDAVALGAEVDEREGVVGIKSHLALVSASLTCSHIIVGDGNIWLKHHNGVKIFPFAPHKCIIAFGAIVSLNFDRLVEVDLIFTVFFSNGCRRVAQAILRVIRLVHRSLRGEVHESVFRRLHLQRVGGVVVVFGVSHYQLIVFQSKRHIAQSIVVL